MGELIPFPRSSRIEIRGGTVEAATITDESGTRLLPEVIGEQRYFVDLVGSDGCRRCMWAGACHREAVQHAAALQAAGLGKVYDFARSEDAFPLNPEY